MLYTPQQLSGGAGYSRGVRIGNWQEDSNVQAEALAKFAHNKAAGNLAINHEQRKERTLHQQVPHSFGDILESGFSVQIQSVATNKLITGDVFQLLEFGSTDSAVFAAGGGGGAKRASACNTLVIEKANGKKGPIGFGDEVYIKGNPSLLVDPRTGMLRGELFLNCDTSGGVVGGSGRRAVCMTKSEKKTCLWTIVHPDLSRKAMYTGRPVPTNEPVAIVHVVSGLKLATSTMFGAASGDEVFGGTFKGSSRGQSLQKENLFTINSSASQVCVALVCEGSRARRTACAHRFPVLPLCHLFPCAGGRGRSTRVCEDVTRSRAADCEEHNQRARQLRHSWDRAIVPHHGRWWRRHARP